MLETVDLYGPEDLLKNAKHLLDTNARPRL